MTKGYWEEIGRKILSERAEEEKETSKFLLEPVLTETFLGRAARILDLYYWYRHNDYEHLLGRTWHYLPAVTYGNQIFVKEDDTVQDLVIMEKRVIQEDIVDECYRRWTIETGNHNVKLYSHKWYRMQTALTTYEALVGYCFALHIKNPAEETLKMAKVDILARRLIEEATVESALPLREALERLNQIHRQCSELFFPKSSVILDDLYKEVDL